jgi:hypothetical protein
MQGQSFRVYVPHSYFGQSSEQLQSLELRGRPFGQRSWVHMTRSGEVEFLHEQEFLSQVSPFLHF